MAQEMAPTESVSPLEVQFQRIYELGKKAVAAFEPYALDHFVLPGDNARYEFTAPMFVRDHAAWLLRNTQPYLEPTLKPRPLGSIDTAPTNALRLCNPTALTYSRHRWGTMEFDNVRLDFLDALARPATIDSFHILPESVGLKNKSLFVAMLKDQDGVRPFQVKIMSRYEDLIEQLLTKRMPHSAKRRLSIVRPGLLKPEVSTSDAKGAHASDVDTVLPVTLPPFSEGQPVAVARQETDSLSTVPVQRSHLRLAQ